MSEYKRRGIVVDGARAVLPLTGEGETRRIDTSHESYMAFDAALQTSPNVGVPAEFGYFLDPRTFEVPAGVLSATELFNVTVTGDWTTPYARFAFSEIEGKTSPYSDYSDTPESYVNYDWPTAQQYLFQTNTRYGLRENDLLATARINYAAGLDRASYMVIARDSNRFWLLGVDGMSIYGLLNDPNLPTALVSTVDFTDPTVAPNLIAAEYQRLVLDLMRRNNGLVDQNSNFKLWVSPAVSSGLGNNSTYNQTARQLIENYTPNVKIVLIPELDGLGTGGTMFLSVDELAGNPVAQAAASVQYQAGSIVQTSSTLWKRKCWAGTYGGIYFFPSAIARMTGVEG